MKDDRLKIHTPTEPYQIGQTSTGEPIWVDPKDLINTPDENLELKDNLSESQFDGNVEKISAVVVENAHRFISETVLNTADQVGIQLFMDTSPEFEQWMEKAGYNVKQDGLTTVIRLKDRVIRSMTAAVDIRFREAVATRVMERVAQPA